MFSALPSLMRLLAMRMIVERVLRRLSRGHILVAAAIVFTLMVTTAFVPMAEADDVVQATVVRDYDDYHPLNVAGGIRIDESAGSGAVQTLNVVWLGDSPAAVGREVRNYSVPQPAEALRMRDWQNSGMEGGSLESRDTQDEGDIRFRSEVLVSDVEQSNAFGIAYGIGILGMEIQRRTDIRASILEGYFINGVNNQIVGPKAGLIWSKLHGPLSFDLQGSLLLGINSGEMSDTSKFGPNFTIPGALNRLLSKRMSFCTMWSSLFVGNLFYETSELRTGLPEPTFVVDNENLVLHQFYCGLEYVR
jgi:hypothetical protein